MGDLKKCAIGVLMAVSALPPRLHPSQFSEPPPTATQCSPFSEPPPPASRMDPLRHISTISLSSPVDVSTLSFFSGWLRERRTRSWSWRERASTSACVAETLRVGLSKDPYVLPFFGRHSRHPREAEGGNRVFFGRLSQSVACGSPAFSQRLLDS